MLDGFMIMLIAVSWEKTRGDLGQPGQSPTEPEASPTEEITVADTAERAAAQSTVKPPGRFWGHGSKEISITSRQAATVPNAYGADVELALTQATQQTHESVNQRSIDVAVPSTNNLGEIFAETKAAQLAQEEPELCGDCKIPLDLTIGKWDRQEAKYIRCAPVRRAHVINYCVECKAKHAATLRGTAKTRAGPSIPRLRLDQLQAAQAEDTSLSEQMTNLAIGHADVASHPGVRPAGQTPAATAAPASESFVNLLQQCATASMEDAPTSAVRPAGQTTEVTADSTGLETENDPDEIPCGQAEQGDSMLTQLYAGNIVIDEVVTVPIASLSFATVSATLPANPARQTIVTCINCKHDQDTAIHTTTVSEL